MQNLTRQELIIKVNFKNELNRSPLQGSLLFYIIFLPGSIAGGELLI